MSQDSKVHDELDIKGEDTGDVLVLQGYEIKEKIYRLSSRTSDKKLSGFDDVKKRRVLIIETGGTIGMSRNEEGVLAPKTGNFARYLFKMGSIMHHLTLPLYDLLSWSPLLDSSEMHPDCWIHLARTIEKYYFEYDGFLVIHGTDTMAYTASALSFLLNNLGKAVILTGAMLPLEDPGTDGRRNLLISLALAGMADVPEVCVFFDKYLMRGNRCTKVDPISISAFSSPNLPPLCTAGVEITVNRSLVRHAPKRSLSVATKMHFNIAVLWLVPGFDDSVIKTMFKSESPPALVLATYGTGNVPSRKKEFLNTISEIMTKHNAVVVIVTQCQKGHVDLKAYETGHNLQKLGCIDGGDMTIEACVTKLAFLMGVGLTGQALKKAMETNLRGEMTDAESFRMHNDSLNTNEPVRSIVSRL